MNEKILVLLIFLAVVAVVFAVLAVFHFVAAKGESPKVGDGSQAGEVGGVSVKESENGDTDGCEAAAQERSSETAAQDTAESGTTEKLGRGGIADRAAKKKKKNEAEVETPTDGDGYVVLKHNESLSLREEYKRLSKKEKRLFDKVLEEMTALEKARVKEAKYSITAMQGQDTIARLKITRGEIVLECTVINPELKLFGKETGKKIKPKPNKFKLSDPLELEPALFTLRLANKTSLDARSEKSKAEKGADKAE